MATRLYLQSTGSAPFSPPKADGGWEIDAAALVYRNMRTTKANTALTTLSSVPGGTATQQYRYACFVSDTLDTAQTISGTFSLVVGKCAETSTGGDAHLAYTLRVVDGTTGAHKALLAQVMATSTEFPVMASAATRIHNGTAITNYNAAGGDRLVLEIGIHGVTPAAETMQMRIGDPTASGDFALTAGLTTDLCPWGELSATLSFGTPAPPTVTGTSNQPLPSMGGSAQGGHGVTGLSAAVAFVLAGAIAGAFTPPPITGTSTSALPSIVGQTSGVHGVSGGSTAALPSPGGQATGTQAVEGTSSASLPAPSGPATGVHGVAGISTAALPPFAGSAAGTFTEATTTVTGTSTAALPPLEGQILGRHGVVGDSSGNLPAPSGPATGVHGVTGTSTAALPPFGGSATGTVTAAPSIPTGLPRGLVLPVRTLGVGQGTRGLGLVLPTRSLGFILQVRTLLIHPDPEVPP